MLVQWLTLCHREAFKGDAGAVVEQVNERSSHQSINLTGSWDQRHLVGRDGKHAYNTQLMLYWKTHKVKVVTATDFE